MLLLLGLLVFTFCESLYYETRQRVNGFILLSPDEWLRALHCAALELMHVCLVAIAEGISSGRTRRANKKQDIYVHIDYHW